MHAAMLAPCMIFPTVIHVIYELCSLMKDNLVTTPMWILLTLWVTVVMRASVSCSGSSREPATDEHYFENFKTAIASADTDGYTPYWLGRGFTAGGLTFAGPYVGDLTVEKVQGGVASLPGRRIVTGSMREQPNTCRLLGKTQSYRSLPLERGRSIPYRSSYSSTRPPCSRAHTLAAPRHRAGRTRTR